MDADSLLLTILLSVIGAFFLVSMTLIAFVGGRIFSTLAELSKHVGNLREEVAALKALTKTRRQGDLDE